MPRDLPIGNGNLLVAFDKDALLREFYFPHVGEENQTRGSVFRFGVWIDGEFSWVPNGWKVQKKYLEDSLVTDVLLERDDIKIQIHDLVDFEENIYLKKIVVENLVDTPRQVRLFLCADFHIYGNSIGDTAAHRPENNSLIHYKGNRYFLVNVFSNHKVGIDFFATGNKKVGTEVGTWKDAEDGILSGNPIAQGSVDSVVGISIEIPPKGKETCYYWIAAGENWQQVKDLNNLIQKKGPEWIFKRTFNYWKLWVNKESSKGKALSPNIFSLYKKSLLIARTQINSCGSIIAANDSDTIDFNRDTYSYMWPRDGAFVAYAFDLAGYESQFFFQFCSKILEKDGYFLHKYTPTGALASSWHPWTKTGLPIQEDETALMIWALWNHYTIFKNVEFIRSLYYPVIKKCADFMMTYRDLSTGLPLPSYDLWEERYGVLTFTTSAVIGGLFAAAEFAEIFGEKELAEEYRSGAQKMREGMDLYLFLKDKNRFARMVNFHKDGSIDVDSTIDASLYGIFAFGAYPVEDEKVKSTMDQIISSLQSGGGVARYEKDPYYRQSQETPGNPWFICTLWIAQYYIALGQMEKAGEILEWVADHALPSGVLAEQLGSQTGEPLSVAPLTWSHAAFIATVELFLRKKGHDFDFS